MLMGFGGAIMELELVAMVIQLCEYTKWIIQLKRDFVVNKLYMNFKTILWNIIRCRPQI